MWKNWLHPRLNKSPWTQTETMKLKELVDLHGCNQWKLVAEELGVWSSLAFCLVCGFIWFVFGGGGVVNNVLLAQIKIRYLDENNE